MAQRAVFHLMRTDAELPADITPRSAAAGAGAAALVTGATGFLGRYVVRELLRQTEPPIVCLVRAGSAAAARARLAGALRAVGIDLASHSGRIDVLTGAVEQARLGLPERIYHQLAWRVGTVYHCAANVNWALGYRRLRASNVLGTRELIRFACTGPVKRICFTSTIAVCYAEHGLEAVDECTDTLAYVAQMPLAYAQTKSVAESLLRAAAARGVPVAVVRPALISGDSGTGDANPDDMVCSLVQGCVASGAAIDCDWQLDCVPVDCVARVLVALGTPARAGWEVLNLFNPRARQWREFVLWLNLYGYPVRLVPHAEWLRLTFERSSAPPGLFRYRRFFGAMSRRFSTRPPYEAYLEKGQVRVRNDETRATLNALDITLPAIDADLLERYFDYFVAAKLLPPAQRRRAGPGGREPPAAILAHTIKSRLAEAGLDPGDIRELPFASPNGIFNEVSSARAGAHIGIRRYAVPVRRPGDGLRQTLQLVLKSKPADHLMEALLVEVATLCDPVLGEQCERFKGNLGLAGCHERELALYETGEPRLRRLMPELFGTHRDPDRGTWSVAMEYLPGVEQFDVAAVTGGLGTRELSAALRGLAELHAIWYQRNTALGAMPWLSRPPETARMIAMTPFWDAMADYSARHFGAWLDQPVRPLQKAAIASLDEWWPALLTLPQTLVHNDFNPRNFALRDAGGNLSLSIFDWELATIGVPQHDLAELLCFALPRGCDRAMLAGLLERQRCALQAAAGVVIDPDQWLTGFVLSLRYLIINRLPLYTLMHRFRPQAFLPGVVRNWQELHRLGNDLLLRPGEQAGSQADQHERQRRNEQVGWPDAEQPA